VAAGYRDSWLLADSGNLDIGVCRLVPWCWHDLGKLQYANWGSADFFDVSRCITRLPVPDPQVTPNAGTLQDTDTGVNYSSNSNLDFIRADLGNLSGQSKVVGPRHMDVPSVLAARRQRQDTAEALTHSMAGKPFVEPHLAGLLARHPGRGSSASRDLVQFVVEFLMTATVALRGPGYCYSQFRDDEIFEK